MLINLRNAMMAGKRLPYDAEVEYLEGTGTQYINTGVNYFADFEITVKLRENVQNITLKSAPADRLERISATDPNWRFRSNAAGIYNTTVPITELHTLTWKDGKAYSDGNFLNDWTKGFPTGTMCVFGDARAHYPAMVYALKLWDKNGVLVRDFIPVRKGTVGYLYDRVSGKLFGNAGTGDFVLGPDVVPVEYIESHGTECIDTPWTPDLTTDLQVSGRAGFATTNRGMLLSAYNSGSPNNLNISLELYSDLQFRVYAFADVFSRFKCADSVKQMFDYSIAYTALDGLLSCTANGIKASGTVLTQCRVVNTLPARLGADYRASNRFGLFGPVKVYNPGLLFDFIPVRVGSGSTWEGAMMDVLTRRIYRNDGTGAFTYGNDLKYPIPSE